MIEGLIITLAIGVLIIVLGAINMSGNISSLHYYHRHRVSEADKKIFARLIGIGTILCGIGVIALALFTFAITSQAYYAVGGIVFAALFVVGMGISFYAMIKYNKGIF